MTKSLQDKWSEFLQDADFNGKQNEQFRKFFDSVSDEIQEVSASAFFAGYSTGFGRKPLLAAWDKFATEAFVNYNP